MEPRVRIIGIGSPYGDDRAGWEAVERLRDSPLVADALPGAVGVSRCDTPANLLLEDYGASEALIVVDAICSGVTPGTVRRLGGSEVGHLRAPWSTHGFDVGGALALGQTMHALPPKIVLYGIEMHPEFTSGEMSAPVADALDHLVGCVESELLELLRLPTDHPRTTRARPSV
jgi:hydrogenase maturation protease